VITLAPLPRADAGQVLHLTLGLGQDAFVGKISDMVGDPNPLADFHCILHGDQAVGFFKIDRGYAPDHDFAEDGAFGLRGFLIGAQYQWRGYGAAALRALPGYLAAQYPAQTQFYLTVNCDNGVAHRSYLQNGWTDLGALYHKGRSGPQHILRLSL
jgi:GNAT superfamily N-acetyltransferase